LLGQVNIESKNPNFGGNAANAAQNKKKKKTKQSPTAPVAPKKPAAAKKPAGFSNPFAIPGIKTDIKPVSGLHDLYFVFKNENVKGDQPLMSVSNIKFNNVKVP